MTEIRFSVYGDQPSPLEDPAFLLGEFQTQQHVNVSISRLKWDEAWPQLLKYALYGEGPHISHIGAIWTGTLVQMNALRPFTAQEIAALGGSDAFFASTWQNCVLPSRSEVWGIPFTAFTYLIYYRRDLLRQAGVDEATAFSSAAAMIDTLDRLGATGVVSPLVLPSGNPYRGRVHIAASWIWGAGGDFVSDDGRAALFDQAEARAGLSAFFSLYRHLAPADYNLKDSESLRRFATGQAAITIAGSSAPAVIANVGTQQVLDNLGVAMVPGVPWVGGSNLVIWREAQMLSSRERAVIALVRFLSKPGVQSKYATATNSLPARSDAMRDWPPELAVVNEVCQHTLKVGRTYKPTLIWVRMLNDLSQTLDMLTAEVLADPRREIGEFLDQHLRPLAERFNLMLAR